MAATTQSSFPPTFEPEAVNYQALLTHRSTSALFTSYHPNMFLFSIELIYFNVASEFISVVGRGLQHTQFTDSYFDEPIDRQLGNSYQTFIWTRLNKRIPEIQQYLEYIGQRWGAEQNLQSLLDMVRDVYRSIEVFGANGYLSSMRLFWDARELLEDVGLAAFNSLEMAQAYLRLQLKFKNQYFALLSEDLLDFKNTERTLFHYLVQIVRRFAETFRKFNQTLFLPLDSSEPLWYQSKLSFDSIRVI